MRNFTPALANSNSPQFRTLATNLENTLNPIYRKILPSNFIGVRINGFSEGSIAVNSSLLFESNSVPPAPSEVVRALSNELQNGTMLGNLTISPATIQSDDITLNNLEPLSLNISFVIEDKSFTESLINSASDDFMSLQTSVINWLESVLKSGFDQNVLPNSTAMFSNDSTKVQVIARIRINTTRVEDRPLLRDLIIKNVSTSGFDIIKSSIQVNGESVAANNIQVSIRFEDTNFDAALNSRSSTQFKELSNRVTNVMNNIFANDSNFIEVIINRFRAGSIIADTEAVFKSGTTDRSNVVQKLVDSAETFTNASFSLDTSFLTGTTSTTSATTTTRASTATTGSTVNQVSTTAASTAAVNVTEATTASVNVTEATTAAANVTEATTSVNVTEATTAAANVTEATTAAANVTEATTSVNVTEATTAAANVTEATTSANVTEATTTSVNVTEATTTSANKQQQQLPM
ncbi:uncharacterized protein LOC144669945 [Cetorhinus maximus]